MLQEDGPPSICWIRRLGTHRVIIRPNYTTDALQTTDRSRVEQRVCVVLWYVQSHPAQKLTHFHGVYKLDISAGSFQLKQKM